MHYEVFNHTTSRNEHRICVGFSQKPADEIRILIKHNGGRFRRSSGAESRSLWYIPRSSGVALVAALDAIEHELGELLRPLLAPFPVAPVPPPPVVVPAAYVIIVDDVPMDDHGGAVAASGPRKRQRRSARGDGGTCVACQWQLAMLRQTGR